jgi:hypothetical protein
MFRMYLDLYNGYPTTNLKNFVRQADFIMFIMFIMSPMVSRVLVAISQRHIFVLFLDSNKSSHSSECLRNPNAKSQ